MSIIAGSAALDDLDFVDHYVSLVRDNRSYLLSELNKIGVKTYPSDANFIVANFGEKLDVVFKKLNDKNILVNNVSGLPLLDGCLRIAVGTKNQMETLVNEIKDVKFSDKRLLNAGGIIGRRNEQVFNFIAFPV